jgi:hypothetical protein
MRNGGPRERNSCMYRGQTGFRLYDRGEDDGPRLARLKMVDERIATPPMVIVATPAKSTRIGILRTISHGISSSVRVRSPTFGAARLTRRRVRTGRCADRASARLRRLPTAVRSNALRSLVRARGAEGLRCRAEARIIATDCDSDPRRGVEQLPLNRRQHVITEPVSEPADGDRTAYVTVRAEDRTCDARELWRQFARRMGDERVPHARVHGGQRTKARMALPPAPVSIGYASPGRIVSRTSRGESTRYMHIDRRDVFASISLIVRFADRADSCRPADERHAAARSRLGAIRGRVIRFGNAQVLESAGGRDPVADFRTAAVEA